MIDRVRLEVQLITKLMHNHKDYFTYSTLLSDKLFNDELHRKIYKKIVQIIQKGNTPDLITVSAGFETDELNYIVKGELMVNGKHLKAGDMWIYEPNEVSNVENLTDNELIVVRWPSIPSDKYLK